MKKYSVIYQLDSKSPVINEIDTDDHKAATSIADHTQYLLGDLATVRIINNNTYDETN